MKHTREPGFYWVRFKPESEWCVCCWHADEHGQGWFAPGRIQVFQDFDIFTIDENRIIKN